MSQLPVKTLSNDQKTQMGIDFSQHQMPDFQERDEDYDIEGVIDDIQRRRNREHPGDIYNSHSKFAKENPELFSIATKRKLTPNDRKIMLFQLNMRKRVASGEISYEKASTAVTMFVGMNNPNPRETYKLSLTYIKLLAMKNGISPSSKTKKNLIEELKELDEIRYV